MLPVNGLVGGGVVLEQLSSRVVVCANNGTNGGGASSTCLYSDDGITWNASTVPSGALVAFPTYIGNEMWLALDVESTSPFYFLLSTDNGVTFNYDTSRVLANKPDYLTGNSDGSVLFVIQNNGATSRYSFDKGVSWTTISGLPPANLVDVFVANGYFIGTNKGTSTVRHGAVKSNSLSNPMTWTVLGNFSTGEMLGAVDAFYTSNNEMYHRFNNGGGSYYRSVNGGSIGAVTGTGTGGIGTRNGKRGAYKLGVWLLCNSSNTYRSTNGTSFSVVSSVTAGAYEVLGDLFVKAGADGIFTSSDGLTWNNRYTFTSSYTIGNIYIGRS